MKGPFPPTTPKATTAWPWKASALSPSPPHQIFRMEAEHDIDRGAFNYEEKIKHHLGKDLFDLVMLGVGTDGHTASLFPQTSALHIVDKLAIANYLPEHKTWRMTLTFSAIAKSAHTAIYALGSSKRDIVAQVLKAPIESQFPSSRLGTEERKALWIMDLLSAGKIS